MSRLDQVEVFDKQIYEMSHATSMLPIMVRKRSITLLNGEDKSAKGQANWSKLDKND